MVYHLPMAQINTDLILILTRLDDDKREKRTESPRGVQDAVAGGLLNYLLLPSALNRMTFRSTDFQVPAQVRFIQLFNTYSSKPALSALIKTLPTSQNGLK